jgi:hypothetical protein
MAIAAGYPDTKGALTRAALKVGISHQTLGRWTRAELNPPPHKIVQEKKQTMEEALVGLFDLHVQAANDTIEDADHHDVMGGIKITVEALQNLTGQGQQAGNGSINILIAESHNYLNPAETAPGASAPGSRVVEVQRR